MTDGKTGSKDSGETLTHAQRRYLQTIFDYFQEKGAWPKRRYLERALIREDLDARQIGQSLIGRIGDPPYISSWDSDSDAVLTVQDMRLCRGSRDVLDAFIQALRLCVETYRNATTDADPEISSLNLMLRLKMTSEMAKKVGLMFQVEPSLFRTFNQDSMQWTMTIPYEVVRYRNVESLEDYLAARQAPTSHVNEVEVPGAAPQSTHGHKTPGNEVFIVHGHDDAARETTARFIEQLGLRPIILHEQANAGKTIIEKFEQHANVSFAVVLLTPDDVGAWAKTPADLKPRARQNVILELGYFCGALGRNHVCALYKGNVELPSDFQGVVYVSMDDRGAWKMGLFREFKAAKLPIKADNDWFWLIGQNDQDPPPPPQPSESLDQLVEEGEALSANWETSAAALAVWERALALDGKRAYFWHKKGEALYRLDHINESLAASEHALTLDDSYAWTWYNKGQALCRLERYDEALVAAERALTLDSGQTWIWNLKGWALNYLNRHEEALTAAERALALDSGQTWIWNTKGEALNGLGRYDEALVAFDQAISLNPGNASAWREKARALRNLGRTDEAEEAERRALAID